MLKRIEGEEIQAIIRQNFPIFELGDEDEIDRDKTILTLLDAQLSADRKEFIEMVEGALLTPKERVKVTDNALKSHYRETMETSRVPSDYMLMMTEGGDADAIAYANCFAQIQAILKEVE